jgi:hypothetical protein
MGEFAPLANRWKMDDNQEEPADFMCDSRIQAAPEEMPNESVRQLAEILHYSP